MTSIEKQMKIADEILSKLELFDPTCILAGGAPRDWYFGNNATDLDFYVHWRPEFKNQKWRYLSQLTKIGFKFNPKYGENLPPNYKRNKHLIAVYEGKYKNEIVQIMFMDEPTFSCVIDLFPFGICQAWYKGKDNIDYHTNSPIHVSRNFNKSVKHKALWILNDLYNDADGYVKKIRSKFPEYEFFESFRQ